MIGIEDVDGDGAGVVAGVREEAVVGIGAGVGAVAGAGVGGGGKAQVGAGVGCRNGDVGLESGPPTATEPESGPGPEKEP